MSESRAKTKERLKAEVEAATKVMRVHEAEWLHEFRQAANPFVAIKRYLSAEQVKRRAAANEPWNAARKALADFVSSKKRKGAA